MGFLLLGALHASNRPEGAFRDCRPAQHVWEGEQVVLDLRRKAQHCHDLCHPRAGDPFPPSDRRLAGNLARLKEGLPLDGFAEEIDHPGLPIDFRRATAWAWSDKARDPVGGHPPRQGTDLPVDDGEENGFDSLFAVSTD